MSYSTHTGGNMNSFDDGLLRFMPWVIVFVNITEKFAVSILKTSVFKFT
jgi:hypothetical protein